MMSHTHTYNSAVTHPQNSSMTSHTGQLFSDITHRTTLQWHHTHTDLQWCHTHTHTTLQWLTHRTLQWHHTQDNSSVTSHTHRSSMSHTHTHNAAVTHPQNSSMTSHTGQLFSDITYMTTLQWYTHDNSPVTSHRTTLQWHHTHTHGTHHSCIQCTVCWLSGVEMMHHFTDLVTGVCVCVTVCECVCACMCECMRVSVYTGHSHEWADQSNKKYMQKAAK